MRYRSGVLGRRSYILWSGERVVHFHPVSQVAGALHPAFRKDAEVQVCVTKRDSDKQQRPMSQPRYAGGR
jgi:hypothetical protein